MSSRAAAPSVHPTPIPRSPSRRPATVSSDGRYEIGDSGTGFESERASKPRREREPNPADRSKPRPTPTAARRPRRTAEHASATDERRRRSRLRHSRRGRKAGVPATVPVRTRPVRSRPFAIATPPGARFETGHRGSLSETAGAARVSQRVGRPTLQSTAAWRTPSFIGRNGVREGTERERSRVRRTGRLARSPDVSGRRPRVRLETIGSVPPVASREG